MGKRLSYDFVKSQFENRGYTLVSPEYKNCRTKLKYLCSIHGIKTITYSDFNQGCGCAECAGNQKLTIDFIRSEFEKYGYKLLSDSYEHSHALLEYLCPTHGKQSINYNHLKDGKGCPECNMSKGERKIGLWLDNANIIYAMQYSFKDLLHKMPLKFDFCIFDNEGKTIKLLIEYQGEQHYRPVDFGGNGKDYANEQLKITKHRDQLKVEYCKLHKIPLLVIRYDEFSCLDDILTRELLVGALQ